MIRGVEITGIQRLEAAEDRRRYYSIGTVLYGKKGTIRTAGTVPPYPLYTSGEEHMKTLEKFLVIPITGILAITSTSAICNHLKYAFTRRTSSRLPQLENRVPPVTVGELYSTKCTK